MVSNFIFIFQRIQFSTLCVSNLNNWCKKLCFQLFSCLRMKYFSVFTCSICISGFLIFSIAFFIEADPVGMSLSKNSPVGSSCEHIISWRRCFTLKAFNQNSEFLSNHSALFLDRDLSLVAKYKYRSAIKLKQNTLC